MSNIYNEMILENKFEEGLEFGMSDEMAEKYANAYFEGSDLSEFDKFINQEGDFDGDYCLCGAPLSNPGPDCYVHMSQGY
jgi:hypothetical protein